MDPNMCWCLRRKGGLGPLWAGETRLLCGVGGQVGPSIRRTSFGSRGSEDEVDSTCLENPGMSFPKPLDIYDTGEVG